jgi:hypothetical protein
MELYNLTARLDKEKIQKTLEKEDNMPLSRVKKLLKRQQTKKLKQEQQESLLFSQSIRLPIR